MLLTKTSTILVPSIFQSRVDTLSHHLQTIIKHHASKEVSDDFYEEYCECISEFYAALKKNNPTYVTKIVEQFYTKWLDSSKFPEQVNKTLEQAMTAAFTTLIMFHLAAQLAYITHYSLAISYGLTLLSITVGIKITTPEWSSVGTLSGGLFKCRIFKSGAPMRNTYRSYKV
jgi:hypothetical protein